MIEDKTPKINVPVLLIGFNRPETIQKTFEYIKAAKPKKLYIAIDGSRSSVHGEEKKVNEVIEIVSDIDWDCELKTSFNKNNLGAEQTISNAISWVLKENEYTIILEDDIIAPLSFFIFAQEMLIKYKNEASISRITGNNYTPIKFPNNEDYCFAKYGKTWGWATWKREWDNFDLYVNIDKNHCKNEFLKTITNSKKETKYFRKLFSRMYNNGQGNNTWDYIALYNHRVQNKLAIIPRTNLTSNIGTFGLHAHGVTRDHFRPIDENFKVVNHPKEVSYFKLYDIHHFNTYVIMPAGFFKKVLIKLNLIIDDFRKRYKV